MIPVNTPFRIGDIELTDLEAALDGLGDLGAEMRAVIYEFAGGLKTAQFVGEFPANVTWRGSLRGAGAHDRALEIKAIAARPEATTLTYSYWSKRGFLKKFEIDAKNKWRVDYTAEFETLLDETTGGGGSAVADAEQDLNQAFNVLNGQLNAPAAFAVPPAASSVSNLQSQTNQAIQSAGGLANVPATTIQSLRYQISSAVSSLQASVNSLGASLSGAAQVSGALDLITTLRAIDRLLSGNTPALATLAIQSPNLYKLASLYYGDWSKWELIADANKLDKEPMPSGFYERLVIPADNTPPAVKKDLIYEG